MLQIDRQTTDGFVIAKTRTQRRQTWVNYIYVLVKICALRGIFTVICVLLTTKNSDELEIRVPDG